MDIEKISAAFRAAEPQEVLRWGHETFGRTITLACGFGREGVALVDMAWRMNLDVRIFTIDTERLSLATHELRQRCIDKYGVTFETFFPNPKDIEPMIARHGLDLFRESIDLRRLCCKNRKVLPLRNALNGYAAWITGIREDYTTEVRQSVAKVEIDNLHGGIVKINPLADWSEQQVLDYVAKHNVPYNRLYDQGYRSISCGCCTRAVLPGEGVRAGRWWWEHADSQEIPKAGDECGIHSVKI